jgi:hypothetical protein
MQTKLIKVRDAVRVAVWAVVALAGMASPSSAVAQTSARSVVVAVVVSEQNPITNLSTLELRKLFTGQKHSWAGGLPVRLIVRAPGAYERVVLLKLLDMSESGNNIGRPKCFAERPRLNRLRCSLMECKKKPWQPFPALSLWSISRMSNPA